MAGRVSDRRAARDRQVWLMGNSHSNADKSVEWDDPLPNLSDADALIVDLSTLTEQVLEKIAKSKLDQAQSLIRNKLINKGTIVIITQPTFLIRSTDTADGSSPVYYSNYHILPFSVVTVDVPNGTRITPDKSHKFKLYIDTVKGYSFYIEKCELKIDLELPANFPGADLVAVEGQGVRDHSNKDLGSTLAVARISHGVRRWLPNTGRLVLLPPPTGATDDAIGKILHALGRSASHAKTPPAWAERLTLGRAGEYGEKAAKLKENMEKMQVDIDGLERQTGEILAHRRLLYSDGTELEDAVVQAFRILGFDDIEQMAGADEEDAAFAMGGVAGYSHAVVEVKGARGAIQMQDINQCNRWTDQRAESDGALPKGILIPNQHRQKPYPESSKARISIEPNQRKRAEMKDICIIPSCVLFEAVRRVLGGEAPDREKTTAKIAGCRGVLTDVL